VRLLDLCSSVGHRVVRLCIDDLVQEATEAHKLGETRDEIVENTEVY
jgi:hypothetical protein